MVQKPMIICLISHFLRFAGERRGTAGQFPIKTITDGKGVTLTMKEHDLFFMSPVTRTIISAAE